MEFTFSDYLFSDLHKDAYGCRPTSSDCNRWMDSTDEEKQQWWDSMCETIRYENEMLAKSQAKAIADFESRVEMNITLGARDRHTAIRWILDSFNPYDLHFHGAEVVSYSLGLPYHGSLIDEINCVIDDCREDLLENGDPLEALERGVWERAA